VVVEQLPDITSMPNPAGFGSMRPRKRSFTSAKSPEHIGIAAHP